jgi:hypothetical protein
MRRSPAFVVAALFLALLVGCGEVARESSERAAPTDLSPRVAATIDVGEKGQVSSVLFAEGAVWVAAWRRSSSFVVRIDPATNRIVARIPVEGVPGWEVGGGGMAAGAGAVWVAGATSGEAVLERIDPATNEVVATIPLHGRSAADVTVDDTGVWASVFDDDPDVSVVRVDPASNRAVATIPIDGSWIREIFAVDGAVLVRSTGGGDSPEAGFEQWTAVDAATNQVIARRRGDLEDGPFVAEDGVVWAGAGREPVRVDPRTTKPRGPAIPVNRAIHYASLVAAEGGLWFVGSGSSGEGSATIARLNLAAGRVDVSFDPPESPIALAAAPGSIWVLNYEGSVTRVDLLANPPAEDAIPPDWSIYQSAKWGYTVSFPPAWQRAERPVTPRLTEPREILSLATFPLRHRPTNCGAFAGSAREDLGPHDAFLTIEERGYDHNSTWPDFPPRPQRFGPTAANANVAESACGDAPGTEVRWFNFSDAGRHFHVLMVIGRSAPPDTRRDAWRILNTLRLDPNIKPDWPASGWAPRSGPPRKS